MKDYKYIFSIIVPLYNTSEYLEECFGSVVNQTIGFDKIQLIIINDESPDVNDENISLKYLNKYPNNIVYEKQKNTGEAGARNTGYNYIEGKYVGFLDADNKFGLDVFEKVYNYFEIKYDEINLITVPIQNFECKEELLSRYKDMEKTSIFNILEYPNFNHTFIWNYFYKSELIKKYYFDATIKWGNDLKLINHILLDEVSYGYVHNCTYFYRDRNKADSGTNKFSKNVFYYGINLLEVFKFLLEKSLEYHKEVIEYIQIVIYSNIKYLFLVNEVKNNLILEGFSESESI